MIGLILCPADFPGAEIYFIENECDVHEYFAAIAYLPVTPYRYTTGIPANWYMRKLAV